MTEMEALSRNVLRTEASPSQYFACKYGIEPEKSEYLMVLITTTYGHVTVNSA